MNLFKTIVCLLTAGKGFVLATILARFGSAPRVAGTRMLVHEDGSSSGTIGGGLLEAQIQQLAKEVLEHKRTLVRDYHLSTDDASRMGMICGGQVQVLIQFVDPGEPSHLEFFKEISAALERGQWAWLVTRIPAESEGGVFPPQALLRVDGRSTGTIDAGRLRDIVGRADGGRAALVNLEDATYLVEPLAREGTVFIFGAGHISQKLAPLTKLVGFRTVVLDDREEFANRQRFANADQVIVLHSFAGAIQDLDVDEDSYVVLVTRGHAHDKVLLGEALKTRAGYIGMIGSRRKSDAIYQDLRQEGFHPDDFQRVHSPIGLSIGAESPEEIAVSIVAELSQGRAGKNR